MTLPFAGWAKVGITWAYAVVVWLLADVAKTLSQSFLIRQERIKEDCKMHNKAMPTWVKAIDWPGELAESACGCFEHALKVSVLLWEARTQKLSIACGEPLAVHVLSRHARCEVHLTVTIFM